MRVLGLDLGSKRIGVALSDPEGIMAQPASTIKSKGLEPDVREVLKYIVDHDVRTVVVGMPLNMNGSPGHRAGMVTAFVERLKKCTDVPVVTWDERLSTVAVTRVLIQGDLSRKKRKGVVDKVAASYILQGYLDSLRNAVEQ